MTAVLDASAVLALLFDEPGADTVAEHIADGAAISTVNLAEVATILTRHGHDPAPLLAPLRTQVDTEDFTATDAHTTAALYPATSHRGLSLGDRACLALAHRLDGPAITAEHIWSELDLDLDIAVLEVRPRR